jgi:hypothetical protein
MTASEARRASLWLEFSTEEKIRDGIKLDSAIAREAMLYLFIFQNNNDLMAPVMEEVVIRGMRDA